MWLAIVLAMGAALCNAGASVLQRRVGKDQPDDQDFGIRMLLQIASRPSWWGGVSLVTGGFLLQAGALTLGSVAAVQPILLVELPFTLVLAAAVFHFHLGWRDGVAVALLSGGLAVGLLSLDPRGGHPTTVPLLGWLIALAATLGLIVACVLVGYRRGGNNRAAWLGVATGSGFGLTAALISVIGTAVTQQGIGGVFTTWQTYVAAVVGPGSFILLQYTLQAGKLVASQPGLTLADPLVAIVWGLAVFGEHGHTGLYLVGSGAGAVMIVVGALILTRSPALSADQQPGDDSAQPAGQASTA